MTSMSFKGTTAASLGVVVLEYPPIIKPAARVTLTQVPGRSGTLTLHEDVAYEPVERVCLCRLLASANLANVAAWLDGSGALIFGNEPLYSYTARVGDEIVFEKIMPNYTDRVFEVTFVCQPWKQLAATESNITLVEAGTVANPGTMTSRPIILVTATGDVTLTVGAYVTDLAGLSDPIILNSDLGLATSADGTTNQSMLVSGDWPMLIAGNNSVSWTGSVTSLVIAPRWRWL